MEQALRGLDRVEWARLDRLLSTSMANTCICGQQHLQFSQRQGNATVSFADQLYEFPASEQGKTYQRDNHSTGIGFSRPDDFTLVVFWNDPRKQ